jgi:hypothetical protein
LRRLTRVLGVDDDLDVRKVRDGIEASGSHRPDATEYGEDHADDHNELVLEGPLDDLA